MRTDLKIFIALLAFLPLCYLAFSKACHVQLGPSDTEAVTAQRGKSPTNPSAANASTGEGTSTALSQRAASQTVPQSEEVAASPPEIEAPSKNANTWADTHAAKRVVPHVHSGDPETVAVKSRPQGEPKPKVSVVERRVQFAPFQAQRDSVGTGALIGAIAGQKKGVSMGAAIVGDDDARKSGNVRVWTSEEESNLKLNLALPVELPITQRFQLTVENSLLTSMNPAIAASVVARFKGSENTTNLATADATTPRFRIDSFRDSSAPPVSWLRSENSQSAQNMVERTAGITANRKDVFGPEYEWLLSSSVAFNIEAIKNYNIALLSRDEPSRTTATTNASSYLRNAVDLSSRALDLVQTSSQPSITEQTDSYRTNILLALAARAQSIGLFVRKVDHARPDLARKAFYEYIKAELDPTRKLLARQLLAQTLWEAGALAGALEEYEGIAAEDVSDLNAKANVGLISFELGMASEKAGDKDQSRIHFIHSANYLRQVVDQSADANELKSQARKVLETLETKKSVEPARTSIPPKNP